MEGSQKDTRTKPHILRIPVRGVFETNCFLVFDELLRRGILIDPGAQANEIIGAVEALRLRIDRIVLTHGHFDHWGAAEQVHNRLGCPIAAHAKAGVLLNNPELNLSARFGRPMTLVVDETLDDGDEVCISGDIGSLHVAHAPGHTPDSIVLYDAVDDVAFVGDVLYNGEPGLTCYPTANARLLADSVRRILSLPPQTALLPGHGNALSVSQLTIRAEHIGYTG